MIQGPKGYGWKQSRPSEIKQGMRFGFSIKLFGVAL
jgi:hypothetical protein